MPVRFLLLATMAAVSAFGQSVVSVRSGLINFSEGEVFLSESPVEQKAGKFPEVREGSELRTEAGRAEVLLTPGMLIRLGPDTVIRMVSASLIDTRVEFRRGSATIQVSEESNGTQARVIYRDYEIRFPKRGSFRIDSLPREFRVLDGEAEISYLREKCTMTKDQKVDLYGGLQAEALRHSITDGLDEWSMRRDSQLAADNPPPGDLNGDPAIGGLGGFLPSSLYGLSSHTSPLAPYNYNYGSAYIPAFSTYGSYGFVQPFPIYMHTPGRPVGGYGYYPPARSPVRSPTVGLPRPVLGRPVTPARPVSLGRPR